MCLRGSICFPVTVAVLCRLTAFSFLKTCSSSLVRDKHGTYHHTTELLFVFLIKKLNEVSKGFQWGQMDFTKYAPFWRLQHTHNIVTVKKNTMAYSGYTYTVYLEKNEGFVIRWPIQVDT